MTTTGDQNAFFRAIAHGPWADANDPGHRVGEALRRLAALALSGAPGDDALETLADRLEALVPPVLSHASRYRHDDLPSVDGSRRLRPNGNGTHPIIGPRNPLAPPVVLSQGDGMVFGDVVYDVRFEGLPGLVQGGFIAAAFDVMLGQAVAMSGQGGMTGLLSVRYVAPTPLYRPLRYESWFDRREGRKTFSRARLVRCDDGGVCAESEGVFIAALRAANDGVARRAADDGVARRAADDGVARRATDDGEARSATEEGTES